MTGKAPKKPRKTGARRARSKTKTDEGVPLTSRQRRFVVLPSDILPAFSAGTHLPKKGFLQDQYEPITTSIPELNAIEWTEYMHHAVIEAIRRSDEVQIERMDPRGGPNLRYRIELAAAFLAHVMEHAYAAAEALGGMEPGHFVDLGVNLVVRRAEEIYGQSGG